MRRSYSTGTAFNLLAFTTKTKSNLFDLSLGELVNIEIVVAGKTPEKIKDMPASVVLIAHNNSVVF